MKATHVYDIPPSKRIRPGRRVARQQKHTEGWILIEDPSHDLLPARPSRWRDPITIPGQQMREYRRCLFALEEGAVVPEIVQIIATSYAGMTFAQIRRGERTGEEITIRG